MTFYLKVNRIEIYAFNCLQKWVDALSLIENARIVLICDRDEFVYGLRELEKKGEYSILDKVEIMKSAREDERLQRIVEKTCSQKWEPAGYAHLSTFLDASRDKEPFWNIDADDVYFTVSPQRVCEILKCVENTAKDRKIDVFSLDMHVSHLEGMHWSFGVTYTANNVNWLERMEEYLDSYTLMKSYLGESNLDWYFTFLRAQSELNIESFYVENLRFIHYHSDFLRGCLYCGIYYCENGRYYSPIMSAVMGIENMGNIPIHPDVIAVDADITMEESIAGLQRYAGVRSFAETGERNYDPEICNRVKRFLKDSGAGIFVARDSRFLYIDKKGERVLLDLADYFANKGRIPFHSDLTDVTIPNIITSLMDKHNEISCGTTQADFLVYYTMLDVMFIREHIKSKYPKRILEAGASNGVLTAHFTEILENLQPESKYYQINVRDNTEELASADAEIFDITIINGSDTVSCYMDIVKEAIRLTAPGGYILCFSEGQTYLSNSFRLFAPGAEEYTLDGKNYIFEMHKNNNGEAQQK